LRFSWGSALASVLLVASGCDRGLTRDLTRSDGASHDHASSKAADAGVDSAAGDTGSDRGSEAPSDATDAQPDAPPDSASLDGADVDADADDVAPPDSAPDVNSPDDADDAPLDSAPEVAARDAGRSDAPAPDVAEETDAQDGGGDYAPDAAGPDGAGPDGAPDSVVPRVCTPLQRFGAPTPVTGLNEASHGVISARFSPDELTAYLGMFRATQPDIFVATRGKLSDPFGAPTPLPFVNTTTTEEFATVTADGLTMYLDSTRPYYSLFVSTRPATVAEFSPAIELDYLHVSGEGAPYVLPDGSALYYHTYRANNFDVYRAQKRATASDFAPAQPVSINSNGDESVPVVSPDELTIYFFHTGDTRGPDGVWMATRGSVSEPFAAPVGLPELNDPYPPASPTWISPDGCRLYLQQVDAFGGFWVYVAERVP
jgi:hypothetical protein